VYIPASISNIIGIASISWANSWRILISLEVVFGSIGGYFGLGSYIIDVKSKLDIDQMYAILFVIALTGVIINSALNNLSKRYKV
jgi:NitT/TauT family transport system permease protein